MPLPPFQITLQDATIQIESVHVYISCDCSLHYNIASMSLNNVYVELWNSHNIILLSLVHQLLCVEIELLKVGSGSGLEPGGDVG